MSRRRLGQRQGRVGRNRGARPANQTAVAVRVERPPRSDNSVVVIPPSLTVNQLGTLLGTGAIDIIKQLMRQGILASINQTIDYATAASVAEKLGHRPQPVVTASGVEGPARSTAAPGREAALKPRPPIVVVLGHVDHGKTLLLDTIRHTHIAAGEPGAITQHIGAYRVAVDGQRITFLDTPGHEAFTAMRARGALVADIAIIVVAADDGVMPQTREAIDHARAAGLAMVVAINKMDKPEADPQRVKQQLAEAGVVVEEWGGDTVCVEISARTGAGIPDLLESLLIVAEMEELKAGAEAPASGVVIEAGIEHRRGPIATVLVRDGTLKSGNVVVAGGVWGRVRAMFNDAERRVGKAEPADPVLLLGLNGVPNVGDVFTVVEDEGQARSLVEERRKVGEGDGTRPVNLAMLYEQIGAGKVKELNIILKADVQGSLEALRASIEQLGTDKVRVRVIHSGSSNINENDVMLSLASNALVVGFAVGTEPGARQLAENRGVELRSYRVIYDLLDDVQRALKGMAQPVYAEEQLGRGEVIAVFPVGKKGRVAGVRMLEGKASQGDLVRVKRGDQVLADSTVASLKHYQEKVREVPAGSEGGVGVADFKDFEVGDEMQFYRRKRVT